MDILTYALAKSYIDKALLGVGTIKGAPCTVKSQTEDDEYVYVTLGWENNLGTSEETVVKIKKGADGAPGEPGPAGDPGPRGISITKIEKIKTEDLIDTYQISFSDNTTFEYTISNGSTDYLNITNKPSIEGVELTGNKTFKDLNIASADALNATDENLQNLSNLIGDKTSLPAPTDTVVNNIASVDAKVDAVIDDNETGLTKTFSSDKISKTFATIEEVNKRIPQYDVLPTPTEAFGGKVVQFIGTTTEDYIHNYFYECVQVEGNYKWVNTVVQNVPTKVSELTNDNNFVTETELNAKGYLTEHQDISGKVDKEEGKSLIADSEITRLSTVKNYDDSVVKEDIATIKTDYATKTYVGEQIASADHLKREIVTEVPTAETAAENVIYMLKVESAIGADKYKEYMLIDGEVACVGDTSVDLTDYAKKSEIPTELPANGGNSDTVNNHTVETDVPVDAKFTDTIYDDTEVKESIAELSSNLDGLEYSDVAGGKNIWDEQWQVGIIASDDGSYINYNEDIYSINFIKVKPNTTYYVASNVTVYIKYFDSSKNPIGATWGATGKNSTFKTTSDTAYIKFRTNENGGTYNDGIAIIEGTGGDYQPYIPSVKMLATETTNLDKRISNNGYGELAGGKNLFNGYYIKNVLVAGADYTNRNLYNEFSSVNNITGSEYVTLGGYFRKGKYILSYSNEAWFSFNRVAIAGNACIQVTNTIRKTYEWVQTQDGYTYFSIEGDDNETGVVDTPFSITPDIQIEEGSVATSYELYFPSNKMLAKENTLQSIEAMDLKMLGWTIPRECPIQNYVDVDGVFHQRVGRVDMGNLTWSYDSTNKIFASYNVHSKANGIGNLSCAKYANGANSGSLNNKEICGSNSATHIYVKDTSYTDSASFKNAMQGQYLYYELATPVTRTIDGNEIGETVSDVRKETVVNLLNPTLQTTTQNGVTCTNNGDGTYTLNGTATQNTSLYLYTREQDWEVGKTYRIVGCPSGGSRNSYFVSPFHGYSSDSLTDYGNGCTFTVTDDVKSYTTILIFIKQQFTCNNIVFKPMLTTNLDVTYDDFVPYTGDTGKLNSDVAAIKKDIGNLTGDIDAKTVNGHTVESNVPAGAKFTDTVYDDTSIKNKLTTHTHDDRYYTETEVNNLLNGKANSSHSHGAYELPVGSIFLSSRKVTPSYGNWEYLGTIQNLFSDLPLIQSIGEGYVYNRTS